MQRIVLAAVATLLLAESAAADCMRYGATVSLTGQFMPAVVAVNGNDDPLGIPGRTADLLVVASALCMTADAVSPTVVAAASVQVHCPDIVPGLNDATTITERLVGANTANGHTPVLIVCPP